MIRVNFYKQKIKKNGNVQKTYIQKKNTTKEVTRNKRHKQLQGETTHIGRKAKKNQTQNANPRKIIEQSSE